MKPVADPEIAKLLAAARESRLVIFAGAGVSIGAPTNLPSWIDVNRLIVRSLASAAAPNDKKIGYWGGMWQTY